MTLNELSRYFDSFLHLGNYGRDPSLNGVQIQNDFPDKTQITKVAFATDACVATAQAAIEQGAQLLFVHHGLFWGDCTPITQNHYQRISTFLRGNLALYAAHIPLDANPEVGNNYGIARRLNLTKLEPFGEWHGMTIGVRGELPRQVTPGELGEMMFPDGEKPLRIYPFGKKEIRSVAIISGGAGEDVSQAAQAGVDAYITGEVMHQDFHLIKELGMTVIAGGHYQTETVGVRLVAKKLEQEKNLQTIFIDFPTGL